MSLSFLSSVKENIREETEGKYSFYSRQIVLEDIKITINSSIRSKSLQHRRLAVDDLKGSQNRRISSETNR